MERVIVRCEAIFGKEPSAVSKQLKELNIESSDEDLIITSNINFFIDRVEMINKTEDNNTVIHFFSGKSIAILFDYDDFSKLLKDNT